jgi:hypothetical protein
LGKVTVLQGDLTTPTILTSSSSDSASASRRGISSSFFANRIKTDGSQGDKLIFNGSATFEAVEFTFVIEEYQPAGQTFDSVILDISVSQGIAKIIPEPSILHLMGIPVLSMLRRKRNSNDEYARDK